MEGILDGIPYSLMKITRSKSRMIGAYKPVRYYSYIMIPEIKSLLENGSKVFQMRIMNCVFFQSITTILHYLIILVIYNL